jgi:hypothetical protein
VRFYSRHYIYVDETREHVLPVGRRNLKEIKVTVDDGTDPLPGAVASYIQNDRDNVNEWYESRMVLTSPVRFCSAYQRGW